MTLSESLFTHKINRIASRIFLPVSKTAQNPVSVTLKGSSSVIRILKKEMGTAKITIENPRFLRELHIADVLRYACLGKIGEIHIPGLTFNVKHESLHLIVEEDDYTRNIQALTEAHERELHLIAEESDDAAISAQLKKLAENILRAAARLAQSHLMGASAKSADDFVLLLLGSNSRGTAILNSDIDFALIYQLDSAENDPTYYEKLATEIAFITRVATGNSHNPMAVFKNPPALNLDTFKNRFSRFNYPGNAMRIFLDV